MLEPARCQQHRPPADLGKIVGDAVTDDRARFGDDFRKKLAQLLDVPLPVPEFE
jgi:hypothetical protein